MLTVLDHKDLPNPFKHAFLQGHTVSQRPPWILCPIGINVFFQKRNDLVTWEYINNTLLALHKFQAKVKYTYIRDTSETGLRYKNQSYKRQTESKIATKTDITQNTSATNWRGSDQNLSGTSVPLTGYSANDGRSKNDFFPFFFKAIFRTSKMAIRQTTNCFPETFQGLLSRYLGILPNFFQGMFRDFCPIIWAFCVFFSRTHFRDFCSVIWAFCGFFSQGTFQGLLSRYLGILPFFSGNISGTSVPLSGHSADFF